MDIDATLDQIEALMLSLPDKVAIEVHSKMPGKRCRITMDDCPGTEHGWVNAYGPTVREAYADGIEKRAAAALNAEKLRTAAQMRDAVLKIVPADYREQIEALPVAA